MTVTLTDLFAGAGGSSTGAVQVPNVEVRIAANHWALAIAVHNQNHPTTDHAAVDLHEENPRFFPRTDGLWASPECTTWSQAGSGKQRPAIEEGLFEDPLSDEAATRSRLLMFDVLKFAEYHKYRVMIIENVVDIATQSKYQLAWYTWRRQLADLGYEFRVVSLNSMHAQAFGAPAPQSRDRLYVVCWLKGTKGPDVDRILRPKAYCPRCDQIVESQQSFKNGRTVGRYRQTYVYVHGVCGTVVEPGWLPAAAAIDWSIPGERIGDRLATKTRERIAAGIARFWGQALHVEASGQTYDAADPRHPSYGDPNGYYRAWPVDEVLKTLHGSASKGLLVPVEGRDGKHAETLDVPMRTQTTRTETGLALSPFMMTNNYVNRARAIDEVLATLTTGTTQALVQPFIAELRGGGSDARSVNDPAATFCASGNHHALITRHYGVEGGNPARHTTTADEVLRTLTANGGNMSLLTPYYGRSDHAHPTSDPHGTLTTVDRYALVHRHNSGGAEMTTPVSEVLRTLTTAGHQSLIQASERGPAGKPRVTAADLQAARELVSECFFRMLRPHEVAAGMAFPANYDWRVDGQKKKISNRDLVKMAGNAVTPPAARDLVHVVAESLAA